MTAALRESSDGLQETAVAELESQTNSLNSTGTDAIDQERLHAMLATVTASVSAEFEQ